MIFIFESSFFWWFCLLPWIVLCHPLLCHIGILILIFKLNTLLFAGPCNLLLLALLSFLQISVPNWVTTKLLLLRICSRLVRDTCLWSCRFLVLIVVWFIVWRSYARLILIILIWWKNLVWLMKLVNCHSISPPLASLSLLILIRFLLLILILILILFFPWISRVLIVIVLLAWLLPGLVRRRPSRFRKSLIIIFRSKINLWLIFNGSLLMISFIWLNRRMCKRNSNTWFFSFKSVILILIIYLVLIYLTTSPHRLILLVTFLSLFTKLSLTLGVYIPLPRRLRGVVKIWHFLFL